MKELPEKQMQRLLLFTAILLFCGIGCKQHNSHNPKTYRDYSRYSYIDSIAVTDSTIENLAVLGKVWGFVKYYHPVFEDSVFNIDYELFELLPKIIPANYATRNQILSNWIDSLGTFEMDEVYYKKIMADTSVRKSTSYEWMNDSVKISAALSSRLNRLIYAKRNGKNKYTHIIDKQNVASYAYRFGQENSYSGIFSPDCGYRLLALFRYWNMVEYYYPSKPLIKRIWEEVLYTDIPLFIKSYLYSNYSRACYQLFAKIEDTHANAFLPYNLLGNRTLPARFLHVEGKWVISHLYPPDSTMMKIGDVVHTIDGIPVDSLAENIRLYTSYSNEGAFYREAARYLQMTTKDSVVITCKRGTSDISYKFCSLDLTGEERYEIQYSYPYEHPFYEMINDSTGFICMDKYKPEMEKSIVKNLKQVKNLVIDIRSNSGRPFWTIAQKFMVTEHYNFIRWCNTIDRLPGNFIIKNNTTQYGKSISKYNGKVILLVNERTQSSFEFLSLFLQTIPDSKTIGNITAGAGGSVVYVSLPGGINTSFTCHEFLTPNTIPIQRLGVPLDEEIPLTIQGIREGRDEVYERALELVKTL